MHSAMLQTVRAALQTTASQQIASMQQLRDTITAGQDARPIHQARKNLHLQELCLRDQERRLQERIASLQTGSSTEN